MRNVIHLNIVGFKAAVAGVKDKSLRSRPYVIAGATGGRALALDCSPEAIRQGIVPGMTLAAARKEVKDLTILPPDLLAYEAMNKELEQIASLYAPVWENDLSGNLYLDITGTSGLFGPPADCGSRILRDIFEKGEIRPAAAVACNKLVSKVATRTIRPTGLIQVQAGAEAEFLAHQDIRILPGMGPALLRTAAVTGIREIGEVAALSANEAFALFGKQGLLLRSMAQGIDNSRVEEQREERRITQQANFNEDMIDEIAILGAIEVLAEHGGLKMRNEKLGTRALRLAVMYSDGVKVQGLEKRKELLITDSEIREAVFNLYKRTVNRRIRIRSVGLCFEALSLLVYQPDLFEPISSFSLLQEKGFVPKTENRKLQEAVDKIQNRYGAGKITRGLVLEAQQIGNKKSNKESVKINGGVVSLDYAH